MAQAYTACPGTGPRFAQRRRARGPFAQTVARPDLPPIVGGVAAALMMPMCQCAVLASDSALFTGDDLAALFKVVNHQAYASSSEERYATLFYGVFDGSTRALRYVNAGHNPPVVVIRRDGTMNWPETGGSPVGLFADSEYVLLV
jgi:phosphoserine phosphatase RsbU/P